MSSIGDMIKKIRNSLLNYEPLRRIDESVNPVEKLGREYLDRSHNSLTQDLGIEPDKIPPPDLKVRYVENGGKIPCGEESIHLDRAELKDAKRGGNDRYLRAVSDHEVYHNIRFRLHPGIKEDYEYGPDIREIAEEALANLVENSRNYSPQENLEYLRGESGKSPYYQREFGLGNEATIALEQYPERERKQIVSELTREREPEKILEGIDALRKLEYKPKKDGATIVTILILVSFGLGSFLLLNSIDSEIIGNLVLPTEFTFVSIIVVLISVITFLIFKK